MPLGINSIFQQLLQIHCFVRSIQTYFVKKKCTNKNKPLKALKRVALWRSEEWEWEMDIKEKNKKAK